MSNPTSEAGNQGEIRHFDELPPTNAPKEDLNDFVTYVLHEWTRRNVKNFSLQGEFWSLFENFALEDFESLTPMIRGELRNHLRKKGVWVKQQRGYSVAKALWEALNSDLNNWPEGDPETPLFAPAKPPRNGQNASNNANANGNDNYANHNGRDMTPTVAPPLSETSRNAPDLANAPTNDPTSTPTNPHTTPLMTPMVAPTAEISRAIGNVAKLYSGNEEKFSGATFEDFDEKFEVSTARC